MELTTHLDGGLISLEGDLTAAAEEVLASAFELARAHNPVVLDFSNLGYMNSTGIGLLVTTLIRAQRHGVRLVACGLDSHYREIFSLTRLDEAIPVYEDASQALDA